MTGSSGSGTTGKLLQLIVLCIFIGIVADVGVDMARAAAPLLITGALVLSIVVVVLRYLRRW